MKKQIVTDFIDAINSGNPERLYSLLSDDHQFIDSLDNRITGREIIRQAWIQYYEFFPDYSIEVNEIIEKDPLICILGYASGTYKNRKNSSNSNYWRVPAAWTAIVAEGQVKQWQVYADNTRALAIVNANQATEG
jgi:ketosteroid isomerase-like protein